MRLIFSKNHLQREFCKRLLSYRYFRYNKIGAYLLSEKILAMKKKLMLLVLVCTVILINSSVFADGEFYVAEPNLCGPHRLSFALLHQVPL